MSLKYDVMIAEDFMVYHRHGDRHRINGSASIWGEGTIYWYQYDKLHRMDGPARNMSTGQTTYHIRGKMYTKEDYDIKIHSSTI